MLTKRQRHSDGVVMKRSVLKMIEEFRLYWRHYVLQSLFATVAIFIVLYFLSLQNAVIIASIGATAFIVLAMPDYVTAQPRNVIGGHLVGLFWGFAFSLVPHAATIVDLVCYLLAVGLSIFTMVVTDTEHPPAAGTALGVAITGMSPNVLVAVLLSIVLLSLMHRFFKPYLRDLT
jgi:CBS-domain-containing membrane protein